MTKLMVSVQKFSKKTCQEICDIVINAGAHGLRTDKPVKCDCLLIGLKKNKKQYYITTDIDDIIEISKWANAVAVDCRKGNLELLDLLKFCKNNHISYCADIENDRDLINLHRLFLKKLINQPDYIATTFSNQTTGVPDVGLIEKCKCLFAKSKTIAEGGYLDYLYFAKKYNADYVIIGNGITEIEKQTKNVLKGLI